MTPREDFGAFTVRATVRTGAWVRVCLAGRKEDAAGPPGHLVKSFEPAFEDMGQPKALARVFHNTACLQRDAGKFLSSLLVPVVENGVQDGLPWAVYPYLPYSFERLVRDRTAISADTLHRYFTQLFDGLAKLKSILGRGHGNLKPTNVFLVGDGPFATLDLRFSDLLPPDQAGDPAAVDRADFAAAGRILYYLVTGQEARATIVADEPPWRLFGKKAPAWRQFCEDLLNADGPSAPALTLEDLRGRLPGLKPLKPKPWGAIGAAAAVALCGGLVALHFTLDEGLPGLFMPAPKEIDPLTLVQWQEIMDSYNTWGQNLEKSLLAAAKSGSGTPWHADQELFNQVLSFYETNVLEGNQAMDPWYVLERKVSWKKLETAVPDILARPKYANRTRDAVGFIRDLKANLTGWQGPARLRETADRFAGRGWAGPAAELREIADGFVLDATVARRISLLLEATRLANTTNVAWDNLVSAANRAANVGLEPVPGAPEDPVLSRLSEYIVSATSQAAGIGAVNTRIGELLAEIREFQTLLDSEIYRTQTDLLLFRTESFLAGFTGSPDREDLVAWREEWPLFRRLSPGEVPTQPDRWEDGFRFAAEDLDRIRYFDGLIRETGLTPRLSPTQIESYSEAIAEFRTLATEAGQMPRIERNRSRLAELNAEILDGLESLRRTLQVALRDVKPPPDEWLASIRGRAIPGSAALSAEWDRRREALLEANPRAGWEADDAAFFRLFGVIEGEWSFLSALAAETVLPAPVLDPEGVDPALLPLLRESVAGNREQAYGDLIALLPPALLGQKAADFMAGAGPARLQAAYRRLLSETAEFGRTFPAAAAALNRGLGLDALPGNFYLRWREHPAFAAASSEASMSRFAERCRQLEELRAAAPEPAPLLSAASGDRFLAYRLEAYRNLDRVPGWPADAAQFTSDTAALAALAAAAEDEALAGLRAVSRARWEKAVDAPGSVDRLNAALAALPAYGISVDSLRPLDRLKLFLRGELDALEPDQDLRAAEGILVEQRKQDLLDRLAGTVPVDEVPAARDFNAELVAFLPTNEIPPPHASTIGPAAVGWRYDAARSNDDRWFYTSESLSGERLTLEFLRVDNPEGGSFHFCTTEAPFALLEWVLAESDWPSWFEFAESIDATSASGDPRTGPRVWESAAGGLSLPELDWLVEQPGVSDLSQYYPPGLEVSQPGARHPIQYLPPQLALTLAERLGCTLPSPYAWDLAVKAFPHTTQDDENLRDAAWAGQLAYVASGPFSPTAKPWPDNDAFSQFLLPGVPIGPAARPANPSVDDGLVWFDEVTGAAIPNRDPLRFLYSNVAEYLYDGSTFYIAGSSALAPGEVNPLGMHELPPTVSVYGFSDVGLRLVIVIERTPPGLELLRRIRARYASLAAASPTGAA